jgi:hypothetical protein
VAIPSADGERPATLLLPPCPARGPAWIVLQGITVFGRRHPSLLRFARALCGSGSTVVVPEIPEWTALGMRTGAVREAVADAVRYLAAHHPEAGERTGLVGFSFGATQALVAAAANRIRGRVHTVVGFGGYADMHRFAHFMTTGEHEWGGRRFRMDPDPYARWVVGANHLSAVAGMEAMERVPGFLRKMAVESGRGGLGRPDTFMDPLNRRLRAVLGPEEREVWDLLAPPAGTPPRDLAAAAEMGARLADAALAADPALDPGRALVSLRARPVLAHGSTDRLIPFSETLRLASLLPPRLGATATITRLFAHSGGAAGLRRRDYPGEAWRLLRLLHAALRG